MYNVNHIRNVKHYDPAVSAGELFEFLSALDPHYRELAMTLFATKAPLDHLLHIDAVDISERGAKAVPRLTTASTMPWKGIGAWPAYYLDRYIRGTRASIIARLNEDVVSSSRVFILSNGTPITRARVTRAFKWANEAINRDQRPITPAILRRADIAAALRHDTAIMTTRYYRGEADQSISEALRATLARVSGRNSDEMPT